MNEGYIYAISMDLQAYFDTVNHSKLIEVLSRTIKDGRVISLIHKYLKAGVMEDGGFHATSEGVPQGGPLSPLCGNVMLNELDKELERRGHKFVRYADDCIVLCKSRKSAERTLKHIIPYITKKLYHLENDNPVPLGISPLLEMFVITNRMDNNGAIYMFDDETMQRVAGKLGGNLIILPASVHETIVYSEESGMDIRRSKDMVEAVNQTNLREEEILSGEIYRYDKGNHTLSKVQVPEHEEILMPDKVSMEEMHAYGYTWDAMLPLTKERALELIDTDLLLFRLYEDGAEGMIDSKEEILSHDGLFGVERDSWISYLNTQNQNETNGMTQEM